jgi:exosortase/archaeosortase family protein
MRPLTVTALVAAATWEAWRWYLARVAAAPDEAAALVLTVVFLTVVGLSRRGHRTGEGAGEIGSAPQMPLLSFAALLILYAASYALLPPIVRAAIAISTTLYCLHVALLKGRPPLAFWGLVALSLPVLPSLQFVLGYPMRIVSAVLTVGLLRLQGLGIERQGTFLVWQGEMVQFDAPCSGVSMLWAGLLLTLLGCVLLRLSPTRMLIGLAAALALAIAGNALRAGSLFYVEAGLVADAPAWWHDGIGLAAFALSAVATLWLLARLAPARREAAAP